MFKYFKRRGQVLVFYALLIPLLFLFAGVGIDLGWYYLNVSRLQNAADAAVIAGAQALVKDLNSKDNSSTSITTQTSTSGNTNTITNTTTTTTVTYGYQGLVDKYPADKPDPTSTTSGDDVARQYVAKNLGKREGDSIIDYWSKGGDPKVTMTPSLYKDDSGYYYVVHLTEKIQHLFMPGWFKAMDAPVVAVAMLTQYQYTPYVPPENPPIIPRDPGKGAEQQLPDGTDILTEMYKLEDVSVTRNWEWQDYYKKHQDQYKTLTGKDVYIGNWNEYQDKGGIHYDASKNKYYRTETAQVYAGSTSQGSSTGKVANYDEDKIDSLNLDFKADVLFTKKWSQAEWTDFDIKYSDSSAVTYQNGANRNSAHLRIHSTFNFETPYAVRSNRTATQIEENPEDALYVRVESEPIEALSFKPDHRSYSSVRQIFLNINQSNMDEQYRPLVIFYAGPEQINPTALDENGKHIRDSQPVILNLNADARVILFAPNSPVVINGNNHKMQGFVIAKEFVQLTTASDYTKEGDKYYKDGNEYFLKEDGHGNNMFIDEYGNVQTKPLNVNSVRDPDYIAKLKTDTNYSDYATQLKDKNYYIAIKNDTNYADCSEMPENTDHIDLNFEKVYKKKAFNLSETSYYDSFKLPTLKRNIYTYLDNYTDPDKEKAVDMFFTKYRSSWIN